MKQYQFSAPERITEEHDVAAFHSGEPVLDEWLRRRALRNEEGGASRTYVVCAGRRVAGYYSLAAGTVAHDGAPGRIRRNMPNPIPAMVLGRLAVDKDFQGMGIGSGLLKDAVLRTIQAAEIVGIRVLLVHALHERAKQFYTCYGFLESPIEPMTVMIPLAAAESVIRGK